MLSKLLWMLLRPSTLLLLASCLGALLLARYSSRTGRALLLVGLGGLVLCFVLPVGQWIALPLERRFPPLDPPPRVDGVVVLGGAVETTLTADWGLPALNDAAERMTEAVRLARLYPQARIVFTGGSSMPALSRISESEVARRLWAELGLEGPRVLFEPHSRNTWENALFTREMVHPQPGERWVLVTSAQHMPRSVGIFRQLGWEVLPDPVGFKAGLHPVTWWSSGTLGQRLQDLDLALHEWSGLVAYRLMGRTGALFPAPRPGG
ncbi:YdcF family protein [Roseomonas elaeocarpi]|uniref:YdcF family protein n=1 Tax=Roseomonas elaeocarpi TaxID=907779 RepID=A0ABV6JPK9_9PROT